MSAFDNIMVTMDLLTAKHDAAMARGDDRLADRIFSELLEYALLGCEELTT